VVISPFHWSTLLFLYQGVSTSSYANGLVLQSKINSSRVDFMLDTHEYDGVSALRCGAECCDVIDCFLDSFDQSAREGLIRFPVLFWIQE
jgi:hypothetical protein